MITLAIWFCGTVCTE